jgi:hypothetical protein
MSSSLWIAVDIAEGTVHVMEHEADYNERSLLVHIGVDPSLNELTVKVRKPAELGGGTEDSIPRILSTYTPSARALIEMGCVCPHPGGPPVVEDCLVHGNH